MASVAVFVRLALFLGLMLQSSKAAAPHAAGLMLPGLRMQDTDNRMCRSFRICHNSKGAAWTTVQVFSALEPLLTQLKLDPATEYVEVKPLQGCLTSGCCCSTPVEVRFSLPIHRDKATAAAELADVNQFLRFRLPRKLQGTACTSGSVTECPPVIATERKLLRRDPQEDPTLPPLPAGLIPYDGKKQAAAAPPAAAQTEDDTLPPLPAGLVPYDGSKPKPQQAKPKQQLKPQAAKTPADDPSKDLPLPEGLIPYDHKSTRQLLQDMEVAINEAAVAAVPEMPAVGLSALTGTPILEMGTPGAYGSSSGTGSSSGRALLEAVGGYGGRALLGMDAGESVGGYGGGRSLLERVPEDKAPQAKEMPAKKEEQKAQQKDSDKQVQQQKDQKPKPKQEQKQKQKQKEQEQQQKQEQEKKQEKHRKKTEGQQQRKQEPAKAPAKPAATPENSTPAAAAPCSSPGITSTTAPNGRPYGTCYCRYNPRDSSWALEQAACRAALFNRCKSAGNLLECSQVEGFYRGLAMPGSEAPHKDAITAFLYADCPPAPPCSCKALLAGSETATARGRCCTDLQAHCQVPFSGLDCEDVGRFCRPYGRQSSDPLGALFSYVLVKTHGFDCSAPKYASYTSVVTSSRMQPTAEADAAVRQLSKAAMLEGLLRYNYVGQQGSDAYSDPDRVATLLTMLVGGCFAVAVAAVGVAVIFALVSNRSRYTTPLLA